MLPTRDSFQGKKHKETENIEMEKDISSTWKQKVGVEWVAILISAKTDFKTKDLKESREGHSVQFSSVAQSCLTLCNLHGLQHLTKEVAMCKNYKTLIKET